MKKRINMNIFLITKSLGCNKIPHHIFISDDYEMAKLNFDHYVENYTYPSDFQLYKIGEISKEMLVSTCKIYIKTGQRTTYKKSDIIQEKLMYEEASKANTTKEIVKKLFNGREINEARNIQINS